MSRDQKIKIAMVICGMVLACALILNFTGGFGTQGLGSYANADKYTAGETEIRDMVRNLDINWTSGKITVAYHAENTVTLREAAQRALADDEKLQWWMDGDTLRVQFTKPGIRWNMPGKELTVTLPEGTALGEAGIHLTSGDLILPAMKAEKLSLTATSGSMDVTAETKQAEADCTSGSIRMKLTGETERASLGCTSGSVTLEANRIEKAEAGSTSGAVRVTAKEAGSVKAGSTSGRVEVELLKFSDLKIGATSGDVTVLLPANPGFTAKVDQTSGKFSYDLALTKDGDRYVCGDGSAKVEIGTTSGDVRIAPAAGE